MKERINKLTDKQRRLLYYLIIVIIIVGLIAGLSFAWFSATVSGNDEAKSDVVKTANLSIVYNNSQELKGTNIMPGWSEEKTFTVTNNSDATAYYELVWANLTNTFVNKSDLVYSLTSTNGGRTLRETMVPESGSDISILKYISIEPGVTEEYTLKVRYKETGIDQNSDQGKSLKGKIEVKEGTTLQRLPHEYQEVEFLEATGTQYINTSCDVFNKNEFEIKYSFMPTKFYNYNTIFGTTFDADTFEMWTYAQGTGYFRYNHSYVGVQYSYSINHKYDVDIVRNSDGLISLYYNGSLYTSQNIPSKLISNPLLLWLSGNDYGTSKIYYFMIYNENVLIRELIPCYRKNDKKPGMYDLVNKDFYTNAGSGEFLIP